MLDVLTGAAPLLLATVAAAAILGAVKWIKAINGALLRLSDVADKLANVSGDVLRVRAELKAHVRESDQRWSRIDAFIPHPRYLTADDRPPAIPEPRP